MLSRVLNRNGKTIMTHSRQPETHHDSDGDFKDIAKDVYDDSCRRIRRSAAYARFSFNQFLKRRSRKYSNGSSQRRVTRMTRRGPTSDTSQGSSQSSISNAASRIANGVRGGVVSLLERVGSVLRTSGIWTPNTAEEDGSGEERDEMPLASARCRIQYDINAQSLEVLIDCDDLFIDNIQQTRDSCIAVRLKLFPEGLDETVFLHSNGMDCFNEEVCFGGITPESVRDKVLVLTLYSQRQKGNRRQRRLRRSEVSLAELSNKAINVYWKDV